MRFLGLPTLEDIFFISMMNSRAHPEVVITVVEQLSAKLNFPKLYHLDDKADYPESGSIRT